ncbi:hypothetical protein LVD15_11885 [Fulvivirga maritima]|uniref:hypothetical protein n=1 Tax=Fulvivirga maritima TaxID=2904247 RepID=UPI001F4039B2|nr:hypothetical protein [Fulvivirga maritima]UII29096.1 hypothetical protein LVD15_11885 [Fulvivirga maritima]
MKNLIKKLSVVALLLSALSVWAFNGEKAEAETTWFELDQQGNIITPHLQGNPGCVSGDKYCAVEFDNSVLESDDTPPISNIEEAGAASLYLQVTMRD